MTEQAARELAALLGGKAVPWMPSSRTWDVLMERADGLLAAIEDLPEWVYRDREAFRNYQAEGEPDSLVEAHEWGEWDGGESWAQGLSRVLGSGEYWHSGGGIWLSLYSRPDGRFAVLGSESGGLYVSREEFESDEYGEKAENHLFV